MATDSTHRPVPCTPIDSPWLPPKLPPAFGETAVALGPVRGRTNYLLLSANLRRPAAPCHVTPFRHRRISVSPGTIRRSRGKSHFVSSVGRLTVRRWESSSRSKESDFLRHAPGTRRSTPWRSSASAATLRNTRSSSAPSGHVITPPLGRGFVHSDTTLVLSTAHKSAERSLFLECLTLSLDAKSANHGRYSLASRCCADLL